MSSEHTDVLVICTYRREIDLERCLSSIEQCEDRPNRVIVVDGDSNIEIMKLMEREFPFVEYLGAPTGLTLQRNFALNRIQNARFIFFLDDDTEVIDGYFSGVAELFSRHSCIGVGVTPLPYVTVKKRFLPLLLGQTSQKSGTVTAGGFNIGRYSGDGYSAWLPGCSMTYDFKAVGSTRFDERRKGYGLGEDVDFGLKMSEKGKLFWSGIPKVIHHQSPVNRNNREINVRASIRHRWTLADDGLGDVSKSGVIFSTIGQSLFWLLVFPRWRRIEPLIYFKATLMGVLDVILKGPLK